MQGDNSDRRCMLCQGPSRVRLWPNDALLTHLRQRYFFPSFRTPEVAHWWSLTSFSLRHKLTNPVKDVHWRCPQLISRTTDELEGDKNWLELSGVLEPDARHMQGVVDVPPIWKGVTFFNRGHLTRCRWSYWMLWALSLEFNISSEWRNGLMLWRPQDGPDANLLHA